MMELFQEDGHLTQYALDALVQEIGRASCRERVY